MENTNEQIETVQAVEVPQELTVILKNSGLELSESEAIKQSYLPYFAQLAEIKEQAKKINFENPTELDEKIARELRLKTVKIRTGSELVKDEQKKMDMLRANLKQSTWNIIRDTCKLEEEIFNNVDKARAIAEQKRKDELKAERLELIAPYTSDGNIYPLGELSADAFDDLFNGLKLAHEAKIEAEKKAEAERIENEKKLNVFNERKLEIAKFGKHSHGTPELTIDTTPGEFSLILTACTENEIAYDEEQKRIKAENERLQKEAEEAKKKAEIRSNVGNARQEMLAEINVRLSFDDCADMEESTWAEFYEQKRKEWDSEQQKIWAAKQKADAEAKAAAEQAAKAKAEAEAKLEAERKEKERLAAELKAKQDQEAKDKAAAEQKEKERLAAENKARKAPDKTKLKTAVEEIPLVIIYAELKSDEAKKVAADISEKFKEFKVWALAQIESIK